MPLKHLTFLEKPRAEWNPVEREEFWDAWHADAIHDGAEHWREVVAFVEADGGFRVLTPMQGQWVELPERIHLPPSFAGWLEYLRMFKGWNNNRNVHPTITIPAEINHGRWVVNCPFCRGAEYAWVDHRLFVCGSCLNAAVGGQMLRVEFPNHAERAAIVGALMKRPRHNRNCGAVETASLLYIQNKLMGIE